MLAATCCIDFCLTILQESVFRQAPGTMDPAPGRVKLRGRQGFGIACFRLLWMECARDLADEKGSSECLC